MLTKDVSPEMICSNLGLCKTVSNIVQHQVEMISQDKTGPYCALCKMLVQNLDSMLQDKHNEQEIEQALSVVCYKLSDPVHKQCEKMVAKVRSSSDTPDYNSQCYSTLRRSLTCLSLTTLPT